MQVNVRNWSLKKRILNEARRVAEDVRERLVLSQQQ
jgi:hypothetical protein